MFDFTEDDAIHDTLPVPPGLIIGALRDALRAVHLRIVFVGHALEPHGADGSPDWQSEVELIEIATKLSEGY